MTQTSVRGQGAGKRGIDFYKDSRKGNGKHEKKESS